ncbi:tetratricopeptide repeat protein [Pseudothermotoga sp.]|nr:tetratricopeptide repeat protein [Pseudothermotoga sp.]MCX7812831.1 tetratricopeptide repeat protein [Pseudothermotoga sp.]MDW8140286.1 tetratricopeptide repeat protein [Pseudothermotoga sp.]
MRYASISLILLITALLFASFEQEVNLSFYEIRRDRDAVKMEQLIGAIEARTELKSNSRLLTILADCYLEYGDWGVPEKLKEKTLEQARKYAEEAIKLDSKNGRAHYVAGAAIGRLAQYKGIVQSLFMLGDFDKYINTAISLLDENDEEGRLYKTFALIASGMRYRDVPWPLYNYKKSEELLLKALELTPNYPNILLELGYLYLKMNQREKAKEMFRKVLESEPHPWLIGAHREAMKDAQGELEKLK